MKSAFILLGKKDALLAALCLLGSGLMAQRLHPVQWSAAERWPFERAPMIYPSIHFQPDTTQWRFRPNYGDWEHVSEPVLLELRPSFGHNFLVADDYHSKALAKHAEKRYATKGRPAGSAWHAALLEMQKPKHALDARLLDSGSLRENGWSYLWGEWDAHPAAGSSHAAKGQQVLMAGGESESGMPESFSLRLDYFREDKDKYKHWLLPLAKQVRMEGRLPAVEDYYTQADSIVLVHHEPLKGWTRYNSFAYETQDFPRLLVNGALNNAIVRRRLRLDTADYEALAFPLEAQSNFMETWANPCFYPEFSAIFYSGGKMTYASHISFGCRRLVCTTEVGRTVQYSRERFLNPRQWKVLRKLWAAYGLEPDVL